MATPLETSTCHRWKRPHVTTVGREQGRAHPPPLWHPIAAEHRPRAGGQRGVRAEMGKRKGLARAARRRDPETAEFPSLPQHCHLASLFQLLPSAGGGTIVSGGAKDVCFLRSLLLQEAPPGRDALGSKPPFSPVMLGTYCLGKQHDFFFFFVHLPVILHFYFVPNEHLVLSFFDFSVFVGERSMFPLFLPVRGRSFQRQSKSQAGGRVCVKVGKLFAPRNN